MDLERQIEQIVAFKNFIDQDTKNDFFLFPFMSMVLNLTDSQGFITQLGLECLFIDITKEYEKINNKKTKNFKSILRIVLNLTICYNLIIYFGGLVIGLETEEGKKYAEKLPDELVNYLKVIMERVDKLHTIIEYQLKSLTPQLPDKYAKIYNEEKRKHWHKDIFQTISHIPTHKDDLPEGFKEENCLNIP